ncbi:MAG: hypothetical protein PHG07_00855 [Lachnospiraceae bacterium]|nr:hypothetical protein [Lachnospiraceae bacterium]
MIKWIKDKKNIVTAISTFFLCLFIQLFLNQFVIICRSLPDEMGAMYLASALAGNDWMYVMTHPAYYYGSLTFPLLYPFFMLVKNPLILYQCLLGVGTVLRTIPILICFYIMIKYFHVKNLGIVSLVSIVSCFIAPTRATNIDNEPVLILCCWIIVLLLVLLQEDSKRKSRPSRIKSCLLPLILAMSFLAHTRALLYTAAVILVLIIFHFLTKQKLVDYKYFFGSLIVFGIGSQQVVKFLTVFLYPLNDATAAVNNTTGSLQVQIAEGIGNLFGKFGIRSFLDLLTGNLVVIFVFSSGIIIYFTWHYFFKLFGALKQRICKKMASDVDDSLFPLSFCILGGGAAILGLCVTWLGGAVSHHVTGSELTRGYFYLRYYFNFLGPVIMLSVGHWFGQRETAVIQKYRKKAFWATVLMMTICTLYAVKSFLITAVSNNPNKASDWFYYFAPLSSSFTSWPNAKQNLSYFLIAIIVSFIIFIIISVVVRKEKYTVAIAVLALVLLYQYTYMVMFWDRPFSYSENYYGAVNSIYDLKENNPELFEDVDKIYYLNPSYGPQYPVQFVLGDIPVITDYPVEGENVIMVSSSADVLSIADQNRGIYKCVALDNNEFLFVKGAELQKKFIQKGVELTEIWDIKSVIALKNFYSQNQNMAIKGVLQSDGSEGYLSYGPYMSLKAGTYEVTLDVKVMDSEVENFAEFNVFSNDEVGTLIQRELNMTEVNGEDYSGKISIVFHCKNIKKVEFRTYVYEGVILRINEISYRKLSNDYNVSDYYQDISDHYLTFIQ